MSKRHHSIIKNQLCDIKNLIFFLILIFFFFCTASSITERGEECVERAPAWIPDNDAPRCMACQAGFTVVRRRHHCRNCGKVFCGRCSSNNVPLPRYGHTKPVRVCNRCFLYQVTPFTVSSVTSAS